MSVFDFVLQGPGLSDADPVTLRDAARARTVEPGHGDSLRLRESDPAAAHTLRSAIEGKAVDVNLVPSGQRLADFRLLAFDMDSTLITIECLDELADYAGCKAEVAAVTARAMRGEIDWPESLRQRVSTLAGLDVSVLEAVYVERTRLTPGAEALVSAARKHGIRTAILSGGFTFFTSRLRDRLGMDVARSNELEVRDGKLTGRVLPPIVDATAKAQWLAQMRESQDWAKSQVMAIGDGANDLPMLAEAGASVAFRAKPVLKDKARYALDVSGLDGVLGLFPP